MDKEATSVLVTGATGFVGNALIRELLGNKQYQVYATARDSTPLKGVVPHVYEQDLEVEAKEWEPILSGKDVVIHCAARVHVMAETVDNPLAEFRTVNVTGTLNLARASVAAGVRRFIFISTIKVNGESTEKNHPFTAQMKPTPTDPYGISKYEAEVELLKLAKETGLEVVIIRPVLVYGDGVKGNFNSLLKLASLKVPLPFGAINNSRSMVYLDNLISFIVHVIEHPDAKNKVLLIADKESLSMRELIQNIRKGMGRPAWLLPIPIFFYRLVGRLSGKSNIVDRLIGDLEVDTQYERSLLSWEPPYTASEAVQKTAANYIRKRKENR